MKIEILKYIKKNFTEEEINNIDLLALLDFDYLNLNEIIENPQIPETNKKCFIQLCASNQLSVYQEIVKDKEVDVRYLQLDNSLLQSLKKYGNKSILFQYDLGEQQRICKLFEETKVPYDLKSSIEDITIFQYKNRMYMIETIAGVAKHFQADTLHAIFSWRNIFQNSNYQEVLEIVANSKSPQQAHLLLLVINGNHKNENLLEFMQRIVRVKEDYYAQYLLKLWNQEFLKNENWREFLDLLETSKSPLYMDDAVEAILKGLLYKSDDGLDIVRKIVQSRERFQAHYISALVLEIERQKQKTDELRDFYGLEEGKYFFPFSKTEFLKVIGLIENADSSEKARCIYETFVATGNIEFVRRISNAQREDKILLLNELFSYYRYKNVPSDKVEKILLATEDFQNQYAKKMFYDEYFDEFFIAISELNLQTYCKLKKNKIFKKIKNRKKLVHCILTSSALIDEKLKYEYEKLLSIDWFISHEKNIEILQIFEGITEKQEASLFTSLVENKKCLESNEYVEILKEISTPKEDFHWYYEKEIIDQKQISSNLLRLEILRILNQAKEEFQLNCGYHFLKFQEWSILKNRHCLEFLKIITNAEESFQAQYTSYYLIELIRRKTIDLDENIVEYAKKLSQAQTLKSAEYAKELILLVNQLNMRKYDFFIDQILNGQYINQFENYLSQFALRSSQKNSSELEILLNLLTVEKTSQEEIRREYQKRKNDDTC